MDASLLIVKSPVLRGGIPASVPPTTASCRISKRTSIELRTLAQSHSPLFRGGRLFKLPSLSELHAMSTNALTVARTSEQLPSAYAVGLYLPDALGYACVRVFWSLVHLKTRDSSLSLTLVPIAKLWAPIVRAIEPDEGSYTALDTLCSTRGDAPPLIVIECVVESLAKEITANIEVPTIGIGASKHCDGQILVIDDIIGLSNLNPKFVKKYSNVEEIIEKSVKRYCKDVKRRKFPSSQQVYKL